MRLPTSGDLLAAFTLLAAGCDPGWSMTGAVRSTTGSAIEGASVTTACPGNRPPLPSARSGPGGRLDGRGLGFFGEGCSLVVSAPGYEPESIPVSRVCRRTSMGSCLAVELHPALRPAPGATH